jgi:hypothetical protein
MAIWQQWIDHPVRLRIPTMDLASAFNIFEAGLWIVFAVLIAARGRSVRGMTLRLRVLLAVSFLAFGVSDIIEFRTGAWWRPPGLLVYKGLCLAGILGGFVALLRNRRPSS